MASIDIMQVWFYELQKKSFNHAESIIYCDK